MVLLKREKVVRMVHGIEKIVYLNLSKKQPSEDSYVTYDREIRRKMKKNQSLK